jgi:hypothetical protein
VEYSASVRSEEKTTPKANNAKLTSQTLSKLEEQKGFDFNKQVSPRADSNNITASVD